MSKKSERVRILAAMGCAILALALVELNFELDDLKIGSDNWRSLVGGLSMLPMFALLGGGIGILFGRFLQGAALGLLTAIVVAAAFGLELWLYTQTPGIQWP